MIPQVLFVGRQTVPLSLKGLERLLHRNGLINQAPNDVEYDNETRSAAEQRFVTDRYFLRALGIPKFHALDVTDYEGADIIHDLGTPIPEEYACKYDFIFNGSCFDNMFNPGMAMMNLSKLLKPHGRMMSIETATSLNSPYVMFSPGWFYDFYVTNDYKRCEIFLGSVTGHDQLFYGPWEVDYVNVRGHRNGPVPVPPPGISHILLAIAEKGEDSTDNRQPIQAQYRTTREISDRFDAAERRIIPADGKCLLGPVEVGPDAPYLTFLGELGGGLRPEGVPPSTRQRRRFPVFWKS